MAGRWLLKTEPGTYSWTDLVRDRRTVWDGVKNPLALKHLAAMKNGDEVFVYHSGAEKAAVGIARVARAPYADPKKDDPRLVVVDLEPVRPLPKPARLAEMRTNPKLARLSVMPVPAAVWTEILRMAAAS